MPTRQLWLRRDRLERLGAEAGVQGVVEQDVLGLGELRIGGEDVRAAAAGAVEQVGILWQAGDAVALEAGLAQPDQLALASQLQIDLGEREPVAWAASARSLAESLGPNSRHSEGCVPRPMRPRSWCSCEMP